MYFLDLKDLKISKAYNFHTEELYIDVDANDNLIQMSQKIKQSIPNFEKEVELETFIDVLLTISNCGGDTALIDDVFTCATNVILSTLKEKLIKPNEGRARERRLDVPENLKVVNADMSLVKKLINHATWLNRFNVNITLCGDESSSLLYAFELVPQGDEYENMSSVVAEKEQTNE